MQTNATMCDRDYMEDILLTTKTLTSLYHYATQEASTESLHTQFKTNMNEAVSMQHNVYNKMAQKGWYPSQQADQTEINGVKNKFSQNSSL